MMEERPLVADERLLENARQYKSELLGRMFGVTAFAAESEPEGTALPAGSNVLGVGFGAKVAAGAAVAGETAVRIYVRAKVPAASLPEPEVIPGEAKGVRTDVVQVGDVERGSPEAVAYSVSGSAHQSRSDRRELRY